jgi:hypothetical protein
MNRTDLIAKLLANENLTVVQEPVSTASFDIKNRTLRLPQWKDMTDDLLSMLVGHEVGHALYTNPDEYLKPEHKEIPHFHGYLNVIEDVRIEKLMKRKYPGLRKSFNIGYKQLNDRDFFNVAEADFNNMLLIDKINLYFKVGYNCGVEFNNDEKDFVRRAELTETVDDVIALSKEIYAYSKQALDDKIEQLKSDSNDDIDFEEMQMETEESQTGSTNFDREDEEDTEDTDSTGSTTGSESLEGKEEDDLESKTERKLREKMEEVADVNTRYEYYTFPDKNKVDLIVPYKEIFERVGVNQSQPVYGNYDYLTSRPEDLEYSAKFKMNSKKVVNYLIKEFEMKKAATAYKRAKISKVGSLDMNKLYQYKLNPDIFKQVMTMPNGKNHGMIMLLDWSGSMSTCIQPTIEQVINLAMFCKGAQIPFQVFAFTDSYGSENCPFQGMNLDTRSSLAGEKELNMYYSSFRLLELFSSKMSNSEFNKMVDVTVSKYFTYQNGFRLGSTPLNESLTYLYNYIPQFQQQYNVEKMTLITLTDGDGSYLKNKDGYNIRRGREERLEKDKYVTLVPFLTDKVTKKNYPLDDTAMHTKSLLKAIKDRYNLTTLGFYITGTGYRNMINAMDSHGIERNYGLVDELKSAMRKNGFATLKNTGRDDLFIIPISATKIKDEKELDISMNDSASKIARQFGKALNTKKTSRVLLNQFIGWVA